MSDHYHDVGDLRFLKEMGELAPTEFNAWLGLDKIVGREDGAIPRKYRELIALAVAFTTSMTFLQENPPVKTRDMLIGALLRVPAQAIQRRIIKELNAAGFEGLSMPHMAVLRFPSPDGARPGVLAGARA